MPSRKRAAMKLTAMGTAAILSLATTFPSTAFASVQSDFDEASAAATAASEAYDAATSESEAAQAALDEAVAQHAQAQAELPEKQHRGARAARDLYVSSNDVAGLIDMLLSCNSFSDVMKMLDAYSKISDYQTGEVRAAAAAEKAFAQTQSELEQAKAEADEKLAAASESKQAALDAQETARQALAAAQAASSYSYSGGGSRAYAATSSSWGDEASAKAYIVGKESGGNYDARNGRYYGAYQLTESYLGGDYSPENQDRVAQEYVEGRYGSWAGAAAFWDSHGWY